MGSNLKTLIGKLNDTSRLAASRAASICAGLGHYEVDLEHLFLALLEQPRCDVALIARHCDISVGALEDDLRAEVARFKGGSARTPVFSPALPQLFEQAWLIASLDGPQPGQIRSGHLLLALLSAPGLAPLAQRGSRLFGQFRVGQLARGLDHMTRGSQEAALPASASRSACGAGGDAVPALGARTPALGQYTSDLTEAARDGRLDPVIGREAEVRQVIDVLMRRRQNNPILTGAAGVGKTAVVEGLALRIAEGDVPAVLQGVAIRTLDMGLLQAGASVKGEFESRLKNVIDEVRKSPHPVILFIDEAHTMIGAGGPAGQGDAANLLKPALARGELRTIAATTWGEYKKYFEKDAALARRFQVVRVEEPSEEIACAMLRAMVPLMQRHFKVRIRDEAITEAVRLSHRYITGRQLPDKAVSVLDTACARVALGQHATPAALERAAKEAERIGAEIAALDGEEALGARHGQRLARLRERHAAALAEQADCQRRWRRERALGDEIARRRGAPAERARADVGDDVTDAGVPAVAHDVAGDAMDAVADAVMDDAAAALRALEAELDALQAGAPMVPQQVDGDAVAAIVAGWTGIPLGNMMRDELRAVLTLHQSLGERILGQPHAVAAVVRRVRTARANLDEPDKPQGVFLFVGPSGVGKTETALALADLLYGGERKLVSINMSEYQEAHSVSGLRGAPPGYVGYGEGGALTEAVRRAPYSVVLLDEIEKAHPDVLELFYQVFDKGVLDDAEGCAVDFRNTIIIATSNLASASLMQACLHQSDATLPTPAALERLIRPQLMRHFKPALLGRVTVVPYYPLGDAVLADIVALKLRRIGQRVRAHHGADFSSDEALLEAVLARCTEVDSGARNVDHILHGTLLPHIAEAVLARMAEGAPIAAIHVGADRHGQFTYTID